MPSLVKTETDIRKVGPALRVPLGESWFDGQFRRVFFDFCGCHGFDPRPFHQARLLRHSIVDLNDQLADPVEVLFGVHLGGGTDINSALAYCEKQIESPAKTHLILVTDLFEGGDAKSMLRRAAAIKQTVVNLIVLLAFSDSGHPAYEAKHAEAFASFGCPVFACTPDQFPLMDSLRPHREGPPLLGRRA